LDVAFAEPPINENAVRTAPTNFVVTWQNPLWKGVLSNDRKKTLQKIFWLNFASFVSIRCIKGGYQHDRLAFLERLMLWSPASGCKILTAQKESNSIWVAMGGAVNLPVEVVPQARQSGFAARSTKGREWRFSVAEKVCTQDRYNVNRKRKDNQERGERQGTREKNR